MHLSAKIVNGELSRLGYRAELVKGSGHFFFRGGESDDWIDRTVGVRTISSLTLKQWIEEYRRLRALNEQLMKSARPSPPARR